MKTSTFLTKVLNKFYNGKNYTTRPFEYVTNDPSSPDYFRRRYTKGHDNLIGMIDKVTYSEKIPASIKQQAKLSIAKSLGHTNVDGFGTSENTKFTAVRSVLKAAIKRERASGN